MTDTAQNDEMFERQARVLDHYLYCLDAEVDAGDEEFDGKDYDGDQITVILRRLHLIATGEHKRYLVEVGGFDRGPFTTLTYEIEAAFPMEAKLIAREAACDETGQEGRIIKCVETDA